MNPVEITGLAQIGPQASIDLIFHFIRFTPEPVSYTHLDVYKRQVIRQWRNRACPQGQRRGDPQKPAVELAGVAELSLPGLVAEVRSDNDCRLGPVHRHVG